MDNAVVYRYRFALYYLASRFTVHILCWYRRGAVNRHANGVASRRANLLTGKYCTTATAITVLVYMIVQMPIAMS